MKIVSRFPNQFNRNSRFRGYISGKHSLLTKARFHLGMWRLSTGRHWGWDGLSPYKPARNVMSPFAVRRLASHTFP